MASLIAYRDDDQFEKMHDPTSGLLSASRFAALMVPPHLRRDFIDSPFSLAMQMLGRLAANDPGDAARRGKLLEGTTTGLLREKGLDVVRLRHYVRLAEDPTFFASPDYQTRSGTFIEAKAPINPWNGDPPADVWVQCQGQLWIGEQDNALASETLVTQWDCNLNYYPVPRDERFIKKMRDTLFKFMDNVRKGIVPSPDATRPSYDAIRKTTVFREESQLNLGGNAEAGEQFRIWEEADREEKAASKRKEAARYFFTAMSEGNDMIIVPGGYIRIKQTTNKNGVTSLRLTRVPHNGAQASA